MNNLLQRSDLIYPDLSYSIIGAAMNVHNSIGPGWEEWDYHQAMISALGARGHQISSHERRTLEFRKAQIGLFELDLLVDDRIILELKHLKEGFHSSNFTQLINYLKCWDKRLGILINFAQDKLRYERVPFSNSDMTISHTGNWSQLPLSLRHTLEFAINGILSDIGCGYGVEVFDKILTTELISQGADISDLSIFPEYNGEALQTRSIDGVVLDNQLLVRVCSSISAADLSYMKTYLRWSGLPFGLLICLDKNEMYLRGIL